MGAKAMLVDPGVGEKAAPVGTEAWAQHMRLHLTNMVDRIADRPKDFHDELVFFTQHRAWTLLTDDAGKFFPDFSAFCEYRKPWGLGRSLDQIKPILIAAVGEDHYKLGTLPPDGRRLSGSSQERDVGGRMLPKTETVLRQDVAIRDRAQDKENERLRKVLNAPAEVHTLLRDDLIGKGEAASLGPAKQTPETAAKIRAAVNEAVAIVEAEKPATPKAKRDVKRKVNAKVREVLSAGVPTPPRSFADLLTRIAKLSSEDQASLLCEVIDHLDAVHIHRVREALDARSEP